MYSMFPTKQKEWGMWGKMLYNQYLLQYDHYLKNEELSTTWRQKGFDKSNKVFIRQKNMPL